MDVIAEGVDNDDELPLQARWSATTRRATTCRGRSTPTRRCGSWPRSPCACRRLRASW